ncbi:MAG: hypothetical protein RR941_04955 [Erysipelotrichaceae bacterium]
MKKESPQAKYDREKTLQIKAKYKTEFVLDFKEACNKLGTSQSQVIRDAMNQTIAKANKEGNMKTQEIEKLMNELREELSYKGLVIDNDVEYIIDLKNGSSITGEDIINAKEQYDALEEALDEFAEENDLDNVIDFKEIISHFDEYKEYIRYDQAVVIDFKDYLVKLFQK